MNWMAEKVREFHVLMKQPAPDKPALDEVRVRLRAKLILEEALETVRALGYGGDERDGEISLSLTQWGEPDWPEVIDGLCDLLYVTFGCAVEMGINLVPFFYEVHRANMQKAGGPVRADGKVLKPEGWQPPQIKMLLERQLTRGAAADSAEVRLLDAARFHWQTKALDAEARIRELEATRDETAAAIGKELVGLMSLVEYVGAWQCERCNTYCFPGHVCQGCGFDSGPEEE